MRALVAAQFRTGRTALLGWAALWSALVLVTAASTIELYATADVRATYAATMGMSRATEAFNGRAYDLTTPGGIAAFEVGFLGQILVPVGACLLAVARTRREEEAGRLDIVTAGAFRRLAPLAVAMVAVALSIVLFGAVTASGLILLGLPAGGSVWYALSLVCYGVAFAMVGLLAGQVAPTTRSASAVSLAVVATGYLVRAVIDGRHWAATWATPMGWVAELRAWGEWQWWPLAAFVGFSVLVAGASFAVASRRDLGSGLFAARAARPTASPFLRGPLGWAWRLARGSMLGWTIGAGAWAAALGSLGQEMRELVLANPVLAAALGSGRGEDFLTAMALLVIALLALAAGLQVLGHLKAEEAAGRLGLVVSTRVGVRQAWLVWTLLALVASGVVMLVGWAAYTASIEWVAGAGDPARTLGACVAYAVAVLAVVACVGLALAAAPRASWVGWIVLAWIAVVGVLADALRLPEWARRLSPLELVGRVPVDQADAKAVVVLGVAGVAAVFVGAIAVVRRDLRAG